MYNTWNARAAKSRLKFLKKIKQIVSFSNPPTPIPRSSSFETVEESDPVLASKFPSGSPQRDKTVSFEEPPSQDIVETPQDNMMKLTIQPSRDQGTSPLMSPLKSPVKLRTQVGSFGKFLLFNQQ